jgi:RNA polymerase sigma factor
LPAFLHFYLFHTKNKKLFSVLPKNFLKNSAFNPHKVMDKIELLLSGGASMASINMFNKYRKNNSIKEKIIRIRDGDFRLKNDVIEEYKPFIIKTVTKVTQRHVELENSDEYSVGLIAFNEAIDCYDLEMNTNFFDFAEQVIRRRIINHIQKKSNEQKMYQYIYIDNRNSFDTDNTELVEQFIGQTGRDELKDEILDIKRQLATFDITFRDLAFGGPTHKDAIRNSILVARVLAENNELFGTLLRKKTIPMTELKQRIHVNTRTVERNRKFIIAVALMIRSDLDILKSFINNAEGGDSND